MLDIEDSWSEKACQPFYNDPSFGLQKGWYEPASNWNSFNRFFARYLKSPAMRSIASPEDPAVVFSPADSVPQGVWTIDENSRIHVEEGLTVKLATDYSIEDPLGADSASNKQEISRGSSASQVYKHLLMGEAYGQLTGRSRSDLLA